MRQACGAIAMVMAVMAVVDAGAARADRTMVGIGETIGDYLGAASGGSGGRVVVGRTIGEGDGVRIGAEYDLTKLGDGLSRRFATEVRWTPDWLATHADPGAVAGAYIEFGVGRQIAGVGARTDAIAHAQNGAWKYQHPTYMRLPTSWVTTPSTNDVRRPQVSATIPVGSSNTASPIV